MAGAREVLLVCALGVAAACNGSSETALAESRAARPSTPALPAEQRTVSVVAHPVPGDLPVYLLRAQPAAESAVIFMHGMCGHAEGYVQSFQWAASSRAHVVGLQGDVACSDDGTWRKWSRDLDVLDGRIRAAVAAAGLEGGRDVVLIGYSQGGTRALELAERWPERYARVAAIGAPHEAVAAKLSRARKVAVMAGEHDAPKWRRSQASALSRAGVPAAFFELPGAAHGAMGPEAERVMGEVLDWLLDASPR
jgi:predicted esterase